MKVQTLTRSIVILALSSVLAGAGLAPAQEACFVCTAYDGNGNALGTKRAYVPKRGVKSLRASDLSNGVDFVGSAVCTSREPRAASAVFLGRPDTITRLDVIQPGSWDASGLNLGEEPCL